MENIFSLAERKAILEALIDGVAPGRFNAPTLHLLKTDLELGPDTTLAALQAEEADFTGYAQSDAIEWGSVFVDADGAVEIVGDTKQFTATDGATPNTIYGAWIENTAGDALILSFSLDAPKLIDEADDAVVITPRINL